MESDDINAIRAAKSRLEQASHKFAERIYQESAAQYANADKASASQTSDSAQQQSSASGDDKVVDADYEVVDDDKK